MIHSDLIVRILCDTGCPSISDGAYLFAQSADNQESVFKTGVELLLKKQARKLLLQDSAPISGYPGFHLWHEQLVIRGLTHSEIVGVPTIPASILHTAIEAGALVKYASENAYTSLIIVATPFHQLRAFINTVTHVLRLYPRLRVYSFPGASLPWYEEALHSQGTLRGKRIDFIQSEFERINRYRLKGDLVTDEEVLAYLYWRDKAEE